MHFFGQFKDHTPRRKHGNQTNDSIFYLLFLLFVKFIFVFENSQNSFSCGPPFGPFWSVKYLNVWEKLPIWTVHHTFQESRHPEFTKIHIMFCALKGAKRGISSWTKPKKFYLILENHAIAWLIQRQHYSSQSLMEHCSDVFFQPQGYFLEGIGVRCHS